MGNSNIVKIGDIAEVFDGPHATPKKIDVGPFFLSISSLENGQLDLSKSAHISDEQFKKWTRRVTPRVGDVLFSYETRLGEAALMPDGVKACLGRRMGLLRPRKDRVLPEYLLYAYLSPEFQQQIKRRTNHGATVERISLKELPDFEIRIPSIEEQQQVVQVIKAFPRKLEVNQQVNQTLEQMAQALFKSWFVDFDPVVDNALAAGNPIPDELGHRVEVRKKAHAIPDFQPLPEHIRNLFPNEFEQSGEPTVGIGGWVPAGWSVKKLSDLLCVRYGKDHKKLDEGEYPVYGSGGLMRRVDKFLHEGESVLIPRKGTLSNIMYVNEAFWSVDTMFFTIPKMPNVAKFSFFLLKRLNFDSMNVGSAVPSMTTKVLNSLQIVYPTEFILAKFDETLGSYFSKERFNQDNTKQLERIRDTLLPKLISGAISINKEVE